MTPDLERRRAEVTSRIEDVDAFLVTAIPNVRYLTGFTGSNGQLLLGPDPVFLTDGRYQEQSASQIPDLERIVYRTGGLGEALPGALAAREIGRLGVEASHLTIAGRRRLADALDGVELVALDDVVEPVRARKGAAEVDAIRRAQALTERAVTEVLAAWDGGTEIELALALEWAIRTGGASGVAFEVIVASGPNAALPHARPTEVRVDPDALVLVDVGAVVDGYCSDMTRTYVRGAPEPMPKVHDAVVRALEAAVEATRPGAKASDVDTAARDVLAAEGFGDAFVHSTGHGVGLEIHEGPRLAQTSDAVLEEGMVITIEPGVYLAGVGGVRVEDLVVVTADGAECLTSLDRGPAWPASV